MYGGVIVREAGGGWDRNEGIRPGEIMRMTLVDAVTTLAEGIRPHGDGESMVAGTALHEAIDPRDFVAQRIGDAVAHNLAGLLSGVPFGMVFAVIGGKFAENLVKGIANPSGVAEGTAEIIDGIEFTVELRNGEFPDTPDLYEHIAEALAETVFTLLTETRVVAEAAPPIRSRTARDFRLQAQERTTITARLQGGTPRTVHPTWYVYAADGEFLGDISLYADGMLVWHAPDGTACLLDHVAAFSIAGAEPWVDAFRRSGLWVILVQPGT